MRFRIIKPTKREIEAKIDEISKNLTIDCEIFDGEKRITPPLTHRLLIWLAYEWVDYSLNTYCPKYEDARTKETLSVVRDWMEDPSSDKQSILRNINSNSMNKNPASPLCFAVAYPSYGNIQDAIRVPILHDVAYNSGDVEEERQGKFVLDSFETGKALFYL
jgi:hypothetical protein